MDFEPLLIPTFGIDDQGACACAGSRPSCKPGKHPIHFNWKAGASAEQWRWEWWRDKAHPGCNFGQLTGPRSGLLVLDIDSPEAVTVAKALGLPLGPQVRTARGIHAYLRYPLDRDIGNPYLAHDGMQFKGDGGYVMHPPSRHPSGHVYEFMDGYGPELPLPEAPAWMWESLAANAVGKRRPSLRRAVGEGLIVEGRRYLSLTSLAGWFRFLDVDLPSTRAGLDFVNETMCQPILEPEDFDDIRPDRFEPSATDADRLRAFTTILEQYQPSTDVLTLTEFAVLVDGHLYMAAKQGSTQYIATMRLLMMHAKVSTATVTDATRRLVEKGVLERVTKGTMVGGKIVWPTTGIIYRLDIDTIINKLPVSWNTSAKTSSLPGVPFLGGVLPLHYLLPLAPLYSSSPLYGQVLRLTTGLTGVDRRLVKALVNGPHATKDLARRTGMAPSSLSTKLKRLHDLGLVTSPRRGHHELVDDFEEAVSAARETTGEAERTRLREARAAAEVRAFADARYGWTFDGPLPPDRGRMEIASW